MADIEGGTLGNILLGIATLGAGLGWAREKWIKTKVESANADAAVAVAGSQETMFNMMNNRLATLEEDLRGVRQELAVERAHSRRMELHIFKLESMMRKAGIEPPLFEG